MIRKLWWITFCALLPNTAYAQRAEWDSQKKPGLKYEVHCLKKDPTRCVLQLRPGEKAPFDGILQTHKQAAHQAVNADPAEVQKKVDAEVTKVRKELENDLKLEKKYREIDQDAHEKTVKAMEENHAKQIKRLEDALPGWWERPSFVVPVTVIVTLGAVAATVAISCELSGCD